MKRKTRLLSGGPPHPDAIKIPGATYKAFSRRLERLIVDWVLMDKPRSVELLAVSCYVQALHDVGRLHPEIFGEPSADFDPIAMGM